MNFNEGSTFYRGLAQVIEQIEFFALLDQGRDKRKNFGSVGYPCSTAKTTKDQQPQSLDERTFHDSGRCFQEKSAARC
jgi:hypothetical protein